MSISLSSFNLWSIMGTINEWMDRETRPLTWHKMQLVLSKIGADLQRGAEVSVVDMGGVAGVLSASDPATILIDAGGVAADLVASSDIEQSAVKWSTHLINTGGETITVKDSAGAVVGTVATTEHKIVAWDGTAWVISPAL